eukprot:m.47175 g.47175  ORF g.47175 m.47175 type:complete len:467 (+) comp11236_c0_seq1:47-1447(+)
MQTTAKTKKKKIKNQKQTLVQWQRLTKPIYGGLLLFPHVLVSDSPHSIDRCQELDVFPSFQVRTRKALDRLVLLADRLRVEDWGPLLDALPQEQSFTRLALVSGHFWHPATVAGSRLAPGALPASHRPEIAPHISRTLRELLLRTHVLTVLELTGFGLSKQDAAELSMGLVDNKTLKFLALRKCKLGDEGFSALSRGLVGCRSLCAFDVSANRLTAASAHVVASLLAVLGRRMRGDLWELSLRSRQPDPTRVQCLRIINLSDNRFFGDEGAVVVTAALTEDVVLHGLLLSRCGLTSAVVPTLVAAMERSHTLFHCSVGISTRIAAWARQPLNELNTQRQAAYDEYCARALPHIEIAAGLKLAHALATPSQLTRPLSVRNTNRDAHSPSPPRHKASQPASHAHHPRPSLALAPHSAHAPVAPAPAQASRREETLTDDDIGFVEEQLKHIQRELDAIEAGLGKAMLGQ